MKTRNLNLIIFSFFTALILMFSCENKSLGERQREADSIEKVKNNPTKSAQDELNESYNKRMNSEVVKEINKCITMSNRTEYTDESFNKYYKYELRNIGNKTITSVQIGSLTIGTTGVAYTLELKPSKKTTLLIPKDKFLFQNQIVAIRFSDGTSIDFDSEPQTYTVE